MKAERSASSRKVTKEDGAAWYTAATSSLEGRERGRIWGHEGKMKAQGWEKERGEGLMRLTAGGKHSRRLQDRRKHVALRLCSSR